LKTWVPCWFLSLIAWNFARRWGLKYGQMNGFPSEVNRWDFSLGVLCLVIGGHPWSLEFVVTCL